MTEITERLSTALADRYRIERHLGEGGMATVYLAHDLKHDRPVAVKVLRPELAAVLGAERFIQEIKTTANLQHPHILPLFDSGEDDGFLYYVMPSIEGETLRDKLNRETQLGIEEAVRITTDIADALDYAHRHNVIHRDIKPENILLHDGRPMVADFGIALAVSAAAGGRMTETGLSLGTPHYMSPEQATAEKDLTNRSDIYSLGAVLYEMLTGEPPHTGASAQAIVMKIVAEDVQPVTELRKSVPPHVAAATTKSLEKLAADRFATAKEFAEALTNPSFVLPTTQAAAVAGGSDSGPWKRVSVGLAGLAAVFLLTTLSGLLRTGFEEPRQVVRHAVALPEGEELVLYAHWVGTALAMSADGSVLVYMGPSESGLWQLWARRANDLHATPIDGTSTGATRPFVSPDGTEVAFGELTATEEPILRVAPIDGGAVRTIAADVGRGGDWGPDGLLYLADRQGSLNRVPPTGGSPEFVANIDSMTGRLQIDVLPDGQGALVTETESSQVWRVDFTTGSVSRLVEGVFAQFTSSGHVVYLTPDGKIMAARFDAGRMEFTGSPAFIVDDVLVWNGTPEMTLSGTGTLAYRTGSGTSDELVWVARNGTIQPIDGEWRGDFEGPRLSRDGTRFAVGYEGDIWVKRLNQPSQMKLTFEGGARPAWAPDDQSVVFRSNRAGEGHGDLWVKRADNTSPAEILLDDDRDVQQGFVTSDGWVVYRTGSQATGDIFALPPGEQGPGVPLANTEFEEHSPTLSPDGKWLAYVSTETGDWEVWVRQFPEAGGRSQVSFGGGTEPVWADNGRELFYRDLAQNLVAVAVRTDPLFAVVGREVLFSLASYKSHLRHAAYTVSHDAEQFLMIRQSAGSGQLIWVENFFEELKAKVGN